MFSKLVLLFKKEKRGRPKGTQLYSKKDFLQFVTDYPKNTNQIKIEARIYFGKKISNVTTEKYLCLLKKEGLINGERKGKVHIWKKPEFSRFKNCKP